MTQQQVLRAAFAAAMTFSATASGQTCGNGVREGVEQCDDGNRAGFDGCSARCKLEQVHRFNQLKLPFGADAACPANAFGRAFVQSAAQSSIQTSIDNAIADGSMSTLFYFVGLDDLSGQSDSGFQLALFNGTPRTINPAYDGSNDLDWWYLIDDKLDLVSPQKPVHLLSASIDAGLLAAGPGAYTLAIDFAGAALALSLSSLTLSASTGDVAAPMAWTADKDRGHLSDENLDPALQSFSTTGASGGSAIGALCGNASAGSLAASPVPASILSSCANYNITNTMLDLIVGGCTYTVIQVVKPTQPDQGGGNVYQFFEDASRHVTSCKKNGAPETLENCMASAAYSLVLRFSTDRVIAQSTGSVNFIFYDDFE